MARPLHQYVIMRGIGRTILIVAVAVIAVWLLGQALGFQFSLLSSLAISVVLTLILNVAMGAFGSRRRA